MYSRKDVRSVSGDDDRGHPRANLGRSSSLGFENDKKRLAETGHDLSSPFRHPVLVGRHTSQREVGRPGALSSRGPIRARALAGPPGAFGRSQRTLCGDSAANHREKKKKAKK